MPRPPKRGEAAEYVLRARFTEAEVTAIDDARGPLSVSDFLRESVVRRIKQMDEPIRPVPPINPDERLMVPTEHRHRRGELKSETTIKGVQHAIYACSEPGCRHEIRT